ncbi:AMP-binding enzyme, partial [Deinococcus pimensis]|uniref:AMP-binding enzyme n=1 Tax=Deinococcus pimensis TaxID=309888 RepID=UPI000482389C
HRVELGEIESALREHPAVREAAVIALPGRTVTEDRDLVACVELTPGLTADERTLLTHLRARLPVYMLPGSIHALPGLPLNVSGKLDRHALAARGRPETLPEGTADAQGEQG